MLTRLASLVWLIFYGTFGQLQISSYSKCRLPDEPSITAAGDRRPPKSITLDIDDSADTVHGHQQLPLLNAFHDEPAVLILA
jgi:hypothetical protein